MHTSRRRGERLGILHVSMRYGAVTVAIKYAYIGREKNLKAE